LRSMEGSVWKNEFDKRGTHKSGHRPVFNSKYDRRLSRRSVIDRSWHEK
jgi:hypothetical protein